MGRRRRPYLPGGIFHLTARTIGRHHRFTPALRTAALHDIASTVQRARMRLLAVALMSNHLHLIVQQGQRPLPALMQPLLRRLALRVQRAHGVDGPVFWRPYASQPCLAPSYVRNAIVYTHLNPVRAGLCQDPTLYPWTSHALYAAGPATGPEAPLRPVATILDSTLALPLFATAPHRTSAELRDDYRAFVRWRQAADRVEGGDDDGALDDPVPDQSPRLWTDSMWPASLNPLFRPARGSTHVEVRPPQTHAQRPDLASIARAALAAEAPGVTVDSVRGRRGGARAARLRHSIIRQLHVAGYRNVEIARFLDLSDSAVSYVLCKGRR